jgi:MoxR-like ATPase
MPREQPPAVVPDLDADLRRLQEARAALARVVVGQEDAVEQLLVTLVAGGHALVEGAPGLGKTLLVRTLADVCGLAFSRIQFTPDLMPADITGGVTLVHESGRAATRFVPGPIFGQLVLADEINRATPKTQSSLLEAMQEQTVTVAGREHAMPRPFHVLATQNPFEMDGTYQLPEAQIDRFFFKVVVRYPSEAVLDAIFDQTTGAATERAPQAMAATDVLRLQGIVREVPVASHVRRAVARYVRATLPDLEQNDSRVRRYVRFGVSPRGGQALLLAAKAKALLAGRFAVALEDLRSAVLPALRHRLQLNFEGMADGVSAEDLLLDLFDLHAAAARS